MTTDPPAADPIARAHLTGVSAPSPPIHRYAVSELLRTIARRHWIPVWGLPEGQVQTQKVLQYPVCLIVVSNSYARFYGVTTGLSTVELSGDGWAVGTMLQPAAGRLLWQQSVSQLTDRYVDLETVPSIAGTELATRIRAAMTHAPSDPVRHVEAVEAIEENLAAHLPVDEPGLLVNAIVDRVESDQTMTRVNDLADAFGVSERQLQRLTQDRLGLTPKWLIQRRRLHEATLRLKQGATTLADVAYELGYTDQAHFTRDFSQVTGLSPGRYLADQ